MWPTIPSRPVEDRSSTYTGNTGHYVDTKHLFKYLSRNTAVPPRTVKTAAKALSSWPQRCVEGNQALIHNCTDSSMQLINSRPTYMSSIDSDSHIIAAEGGEEAERKDRRRFGLQTHRSTESKAPTEMQSIYLFQILESKYKTLGTSPLEIKRQM